jgi:hypothetical protein
VRRRLVVLAIVIVLAIAGGLYFALQREEIPVPPLAGEEVLGTRTIELVFAALDGGIVREPRGILGGEHIEDDLQHTVAEFIRGPVQAGLPVLPRSTYLLNVFYDGEGEVTLNFSEHLRVDHPGGSAAEFATLHCLLATIGQNFPEVERVRVLIGGESVSTLAGHADISTPLHVSDYR